MDRRALLAAGLASLAGCLPLRGAPATPGPNVNHPQMLAEFEWLPDDPGYRVRMAAGNRFTSENTRSVFVVVDAGEYDEFAWVGGSDPAQPFPLEVGDEVVVPAEARSEVRVAWTAADGSSSVSLDHHEPRPTPTPSTPTPMEARER